MKYYVDANAVKVGNGSIDQPFRRINEAAKLALPGDKCWSRRGFTGNM